MLKWDLNTDKLGIYDKGLDSLLLFRREEGITYMLRDSKYDIDLSEIHHVYMRKPRLFKKGAIAFFSSEDEILKRKIGDYDVSAIVEVTRKNKFEFYLMFSILQANGVDVLAA